MPLEQKSIAESRGGVEVEIGFSQIILPVKYSTPYEACRVDIFPHSHFVNDIYAMREGLKYSLKYGYSIIGELRFEDLVKCADVYYNVCIKGSGCIWLERVEYNSQSDMYYREIRDTARRIVNSWVRETGYRCPVGVVYSAVRARAQEIAFEIRPSLIVEYLVLKNSMSGSSQPRA